MPNLRKEAKGRDCQVRTPVCNHNPETVVLAHLNGSGMGRKHHDLHGAWACSNCHAWLDGEYLEYGFSKHERNLYHYDGIIRTQQILIAEGKL